jgi:hypothetical protein
MATTTLARHLLGGFTCTQKRKKRTRDGNNKSLTISHHFFPFLLCVCGGPANKRRENGPVAMAIYIRLALQTHKVLTLVKPPKVLSKKKISLASSKKKEKDGPGINELISFCPMATAGRL